MRFAELAARNVAYASDLYARRPKERAAIRKIAQSVGKDFACPLGSDGECVCQTTSEHRDRVHARGILADFAREIGAE